MFRQTILKTVAVVGLVALSACSNDSSEKQATDWTVANAQSTINFNSTKNGDVKEEHSFGNFSGNVTSSGEVKVTIDLASVDTSIEIRDERLQKHVFNTEKTPNAVITADIDPELLTAKTRSTSTLHGTLKLAGQTSEFQAKLDLMPKKDSLVVSTQEPIMLSVSDLGVKQGVDKLQEIAGLQSISDEVPVTFSLTLTPKK